MLLSGGADGKRTQGQAARAVRGSKERAGSAVAAKLQLAIFRQTKADPAKQLGAKRHVPGGGDRHNM